MNTDVAHPLDKSQNMKHVQGAKSLVDRCFIEAQFPVSKMSKESFVERKAVQSQTLTGTGKWWGRKPLVLCRATILGLLLPATDDPQKDREVFLRIMTMDNNGMLRRKSVNIEAAELFKHLPPADQTRYFEPGSTEEKAKLKRGLSSKEKDELQKRVFLSLSYDQRLKFCDRPEQIDGPSPESWKVINTHLGTKASSLTELVSALGHRRFGRVPHVGDSFCGGGSIPFEAARLGCEVYASDLNPVATLLTWAALNIVGGRASVANEVNEAQREIYNSVDRQITEWGIEHREPDPKTGRRWRADSYLYCIETRCPECGWQVPLAASWVVGPTSRVIAVLCPDSQNKRFNIEIRTDVSARAIQEASSAGTLRHSRLVCPNPSCKVQTPIKAIRGDGRGEFGANKSLLREWENKDIAPREGDIFGERLYCIRWVDTWPEIDERGREKVCSKRYFLAPTVEDFKREKLVVDLLMERFDEWQKKGVIPSRKIERGAKTDEPIRTRGWTHWHHLFTPRQLLIHGLLLANSFNQKYSTAAKVACLLALGKCCNWNSRLCMWGVGAARESFAQSFNNQALNTLFNYGSKGLTLLPGPWFLQTGTAPIFGPAVVVPADARVPSPTVIDIWITDPPYADAVNYHEISEFFISWYERLIPKIFPDWYSDSKRALAVKGQDEKFSKSMVECYQALAARTSENGIHVVMFTHQDATVWADLCLILWAAGLRVSVAWCIATETEAAYKEGNYVQGTVVLVLRKQANEETTFLDEVYQKVEAEVRRQLDTMRDLDDAKDPNFSDTDYQLAAYAAALRVLTEKKIEDINVAYELTRIRKKGEKSPVEELIERAVKIACDHLIPIGIDPHLWKSLMPLERLYLKGLELESHGEHRTGVYQELARGFGVEEYKPLLASSKANETRLKTASEFARKEMGDAGFGASLVRHALFATFKTAESESTRDGITWLKTEVKDYASNRQRVIEILEFLAARRQNASLPHWHQDAEAAHLLAGALRNRQDNV